MPRNSVSAADAAIIAAVAARGATVSATQLERWRTAGLLPRNVRHGSGRGRGSVSEPAPGAVDRAYALAQGARQGRRNGLDPRPQRPA